MCIFSENNGATIYFISLLYYCSFNRANDHGHIHGDASSFIMYLPFPTHLAEVVDQKIGKDRQRLAEQLPP